MYDIMLMLRRHHKPMSPKAFACFSVGVAVALILQFLLPSVFKKADDKLLSRISWGTGLVVSVILILIFG